MDWNVVVEDCATFDALEYDKQEQAIAMATDFLWLWTGRVYGLESVSLRPCRQDCTQRESTWGPSVAWSSGKVMPVLISGKWYNLACGRCGDACGCTSTPALSLPGPVNSVQEVLIDGLPLSPSAYRVDNHQWLVRLDGAAWPLCQDMAAPVDAPGTWEVTYSKGTQVPEGGRVAAGILACQFAKALNSPRECSLPQRIQQITRDGVSVTLMDDFASIAKGGTGIWMVDSWVASVTQPPKSSSVHSVDIPRPRFRRTTWGG